MLIKTSNKTLNNPLYLHGSVVAVVGAAVGGNGCCVAGGWVSGNAIRDWFFLFLSASFLLRRVF